MARFLHLKKWIARIAAFAVIFAAAIPVQSHYAFASDFVASASTSAVPCHQLAPAGDVMAEQPRLSDEQCQSLCASATVADAAGIGQRFEKSSAILGVAAAVAVDDLLYSASCQSDTQPRDGTSSRPLSLLARNHRLLI